MTTTAELTTTNGIDTESQAKIIAALTQNPRMGEVTFQATNQWLGSTRSRSQTSVYSMGGRTHPHERTLQTETDLPRPFLGTDRGPTPAELALQALAACMNTTMIYNCAARQVTVRSSTVTVEGDLDACGFVRLANAVRSGYQVIRANFEVDTDAPLELIEDLIKGSPMFDVFSKSVPVELAVRRAP